MTTRHAVLASVILVATGTALGAQRSTTTANVPGTPQVTTTQTTADVVMAEGNMLVVKMRPSGEYRIFDVPPTRQFMIDGQPKSTVDLKPGTVLTATVTTTTQPITTRTMTVTNSTVRYVSGNYVVLSLPNGDIHSYTVPETFQFMADGKPATIRDLKKGMKVSGTRIVEDPKTEISSATTVTGVAPK